MPGSLSHLIRRFFDVASARPLQPSEKDAVASWLSPALAEIFFDQPREDQRHGYHAALVVIARGNRAEDVIEAALLHDVGKRHAGLRLIGRSAASLMIKLGLPVPVRVSAYNDHGLTGARELAAAGASRLTVDFAAHHHGARPASIDESVWEVLQAADQPPNPSWVSGAGITSSIE